MKRFFIFLALLMFAGAFFAKYFLTGGFGVEKVRSHCLTGRSLDFSSPDYSEKILDQPFYYLGKGRQAYVFGSLDGNYVIKFLRDRKYRPSLRMRASLFFCSLSFSQQKAISDQKQRFVRACESYQLASKELAKETELLRVRLGGGEREEKKILLMDRLSRKFFVDLGKTSFLVQRRAARIDQVLLNCARNKDELFAKKVIQGFFATLEKRCRQEIFVRDAQCTLQNMGVCKERVMEVDVGSYYRDTSFDFEKEMKRSVLPLREFLLQHFPTMIAFFDEEWERSLGDR
jgi:hypothetical protein